MRFCAVLCVFLWADLVGWFNRRKFPLVGFSYFGKGQPVGGLNWSKYKVTWSNQNGVELGRKVFNALAN